MDARLRLARPPRPAGFTLVELALTMAIVGIVSAMAVVSFKSYQERARRAQVIVDLRSISTEVDGWELAAGQLPGTLAEVSAELGAMVDIWGRPYRYQRVPGSPIGQLRKDKFLVPINSDYDLYSVGPDGLTQKPLNAAASRDDVIRGSNGTYYGVAEGY